MEKENKNDCDEIVIDNHKINIFYKDDNNSLELCLLRYFLRDN